MRRYRRLFLNTANMFYRVDINIRNNINILNDQYMRKYKGYKGYRVNIFYTIQNIWGHDSSQGMSHSGSRHTGLSRVQGVPGMRGILGQYIQPHTKHMGVRSKSRCESLATAHTPR